MANTFIALPAPAADGAGAWTDCSGLGGLRTIVAETPDAFVTIECSNELVASDAYPITAFQATGETTVQVAAHWMRAVTSNASAGGAAPVVSVGSTDDGTTTDQLVTTVSSGVAAPTDTSALPAFKTIQVTPGFKGSLNVEVSEDGGTTYATAFSFQNGGQRSVSGLYIADRMRVNRIGVAPGGLVPQVWVGATAPPGGGGGGGGGGGAPQMTISRFRPAEGDSVNLVANAMNIIDCQDLVFNATLFLPLSASSPAGTPLEIAFVNLSAEAAGLREQFIGITQQPIAIGLVQLACSGSDTCNGVAGGAGASFVKLSDGARFICDGVLDWAASAASWYNAQTNGLTPPPGNAQLVFAGAVPGILGIGSLAGNTTVIQAISAGYWGQEILIVNDDASHTFKLGTGFGGPFTSNAQPLFGIAAGYTLAVGSSRKLQYAPDLTDTTLGRWFVIGDL